MSTLRGFVYRSTKPHVWDPLPWLAEIGTGTWRAEDDFEFVAEIGCYASQPLALTAACEWLAEDAATKPTEYEETES